MAEMLDLTDPICCPKCAKEMESSSALPEPGDLPSRLVGGTSVPNRIKLSCGCGKELYVKDLGSTGNDGRRIGELYRPQR